MARKKKSTKGTQEVVGPSPDKFEDWEAQDCMRTLKRAQEIVGNKSLMKRVKSHAKKESEANARISRLNGKLL